MAAESQLIRALENRGAPTRLGSGSSVTVSEPLALPGYVLSSALRAFSFPVLLGAFLVAGAFIIARLNLPDPDTWWHVAVGQQILETGKWPVSEVYSFTAHGNAWIAYEWLGEVLMAVAARWGGLAGLEALLIVLVGTLLLLLYYYCFLFSKNAQAAFIACAAVLPLAAVSFRLRPQMLGYIFLVVTLICLERFRQGRSRTLWILPAIFVLWVNTHGSYVFGLIALAIYWASGLVQLQREGLEANRWTIKQRRQLLLVGLLSLPALAITPYGTRLAAFPVQVALLLPSNMVNVNEWQSLPFDLFPGKLFLAFLVLFLFAIVALRPTFRLEQMALLLFAIYAASTHRRFLLFFVLVFAPVLSVLVARWMPGYDAGGDRHALNAVIISILAAGLFWFLPSGQQLEGVVAKDFPRQAVEYLRQHPVPGHMFNQYDWGGYLLWSLGPAQKVFIDGRTDIYEYAGVFPDYMRIAHLERDTLPLLRKYGIESALIEPDSPLATLLASLPGWKQTYADSVSSIFVHQTEEQSQEPKESGGR